MFGLSNPQRFMAFTGPLTPVLWAAAALLLAVGTWLSFSAPADYQQGDTVRIMFVHVPAASLGLGAYAALGVASFFALVFRHALADAAARAGEVDVAVNNAGVVTGVRLEDATEEGIRRTFEVNALAPYWLTRAVLPGMRARDRGAVVTVASAAGLVGVARQTDYSATKHAAVGFAESLAAELRKDGSRVTSLAVCPFYIDTGMFAGVRSRVPWLLPVLDPRHVAQEVLDAVEAGRTRLLLPRAVGLIAPLRALPAPVFDRAMDVLGVNATMDGFTGRRSRLFAGRETAR